MVKLEGRIAWLLTDRDHSIYHPEMIDRREIAYSNAKVVLRIEIVEFKNKIRRNAKEWEELGTYVIAKLSIH